LTFKNVTMMMMVIEDEGSWVMLMMMRMCTNFEGNQCHWIIEWQRVRS